MPRSKRNQQAATTDEAQTPPSSVQAATPVETPATKKGGTRGRKRKLAEVQAEESPAPEPQVQEPVPEPQVQEPAKKRGRKSKKSQPEEEVKPEAVNTEEVQPAETVAPAVGAPEKKKKGSPREFVFMEQKEDGVWYDTKWHYTQKRPNEASQAGTKALRRHMKRHNITKTEAPIALRERDTNNLYFYNGELIPLEEPKTIQRKGLDRDGNPVKPYVVANQVNCAVPDGTRNPREITCLGRGKGYKLIEVS